MRIKHVHSASQILIEAIGFVALLFYCYPKAGNIVWDFKLLGIIRF
jgi:hypothetical protein